jgi:hypothetical protein
LGAAAASVALTMEGWTSKDHRHVHCIESWKLTSFVLTSKRLIFDRDALASVIEKWKLADRVRAIVSDNEHTTIECALPSLGAGDCKIVRCARHTLQGRCSPTLMSSGTCAIGVMWQ